MSYPYPIHIAFYSKKVISSEWGEKSKTVLDKYVGAWILMWETTGDGLFTEEMLL